MGHLKSHGPAFHIPKSIRTNTLGLGKDTSQAIEKSVDMKWEKAQQSKAKGKGSLGLDYGQEESKKLHRGVLQATLGIETRQEMDTTLQKHWEKASHIQGQGKVIHKNERVQVLSGAIGIEQRQNDSEVEELLSKADAKLNATKSKATTEHVHSHNVLQASLGITKTTSSDSLNERLNRANQIKPSKNPAPSSLHDRSIAKASLGLERNNSDNSLHLGERLHRLDQLDPTDHPVTHHAHQGILKASLGIEPSKPDLDAETMDHLVRAQQKLSLNSELMPEKHHARVVIKTSLGMDQTSDQDEQVYQDRIRRASRVEEPLLSPKTELGRTKSTKTSPNNIRRRGTIFAESIKPPSAPMRRGTIFGEVIKKT